VDRDVAQFLDDYFAELDAGNAAIFAGAGLSAPAGFVDWRELIRPLAKELGLNIDLESDLVAVAQFHVNENGSNRHRLHRAVIEALSADNPPTENHRLLARLPVTTWWTTNYDKLIETALKDAGKIVDVKSAVPQLANTRPRRDAIVYKMHGDVERPDEAVVTRDDYERYPRDRGAFINALAGDLVSKTFLFLGFSFTDPNLEHVLSHVRITFEENQRRHYAIFRKRTKNTSETAEEFEHAKTRQVLVLEDLKRFNIRAVLVDEYSDVMALLRDLERRYRRQTVLGVGSALLTGAIEEVMRAKNTHIEDALIIRPFPLAISDEKERQRVWEAYRNEIISGAGIALFLFGNKGQGTAIVPSDGMKQEFEIALKHGLAVLPIGATGSISEQLAKELLATDGNALTGGTHEALEALSKPVADLMTLIDPIVDLVRKLRAGE
jgi:hypothetical protein